MTAQGTVPVYGQRAHGVRPIPTAENGRLSATGRIALFAKDSREGKDDREGKDAGEGEDKQGKTFFTVLDNVPLSYAPGTPTITASSASLLEGMSEEPHLDLGKLSSCFDLVGVETLTVSFMQAMCSSVYLSG